MINSSDEQDNKKDEEEFIIHKAAKTTKKRLPEVFEAVKIAEKCWQLHQQILQNAVNEFCQKIVQQINNNYKGTIKIKKKNAEESKQQQQPKQKRNKSTNKKKLGKKQEQRKQKKNERTKKDSSEQEQDQQQQISEQQKKLNRTEKLIIPICIRKSQQQYLNLFIDKLILRFQKFTNSKDKDKGKNKKKKKEMQSEEQPQQIQNKRLNKRYNVICSADYINILLNEKDDIRQVALSIHQQIKHYHLDGHLTIFITKNVVNNFSIDEVYILEEGLSNETCVIILPTYHSFQQALYRKISRHQIIPIYLFEHKSLFCQLFYNCICDPKILGYLPKESLKLIDDFQQFPITYAQGTNRLIYCLQRLQILRKRGNTKFKFIDINNLQRSIEKALIKVFKFFYIRHQTMKKLCKCILDEGEVFNTLDKYLNKISYFMNKQDKYQNEIDLVAELRQVMITYIQRQVTIKDFSSYLKQNPFESKKSKKKDKMMQRYQINNSHSIDEKNLLEQQIKLVINQFTSEIKKLARNFKWEQFNFIQRKKPMIPFDIFSSIGQLSPNHKCLIEFIYQKISIPLARVIYRFCQQGQMQYGQLMYYIKDLQMFGLIDVSQSTLNPIVTPAFFTKATYYNRKMMM